jgi:argininosuccinate synthase
MNNYTGGIMKKVVLGYSGGLDTSILITLIKEKYHAEVITLTVDIGQHEDVEVVKQKALYSGACEAYVIDARDEFCEEYVLPTLKANAVYENAYPLATALARPLIAKYLVAFAQKCNADCVAHGCTGKGNDQVRLESAITLLDPSIPIWAPIRDYSLSRDYEIAYAAQHNIPVSEKMNIYSIDENLWGRSIECGVL